MKRLIVFIVFFTYATFCFGAITEWYVNDAGSGTGAGTTEANAMSFTTFTDFMVTGGTHTAAAGDRFNIKGAITARTTTVDTWVNGGTITSPVIVRGYNSTIGDLTSLARTNGNGPLVTTNYPTISYTTGSINVTGNFMLFEALSVTSAPTSTANICTFKLSGTDLVVKRCAIVNSGTTTGESAVTCVNTIDAVIDSDLTLSGASGGNFYALDMQSTDLAYGNRIKGGASNGGIRCDNAAVIVRNTIFVSTGIGIKTNNTGGNDRIFDNTIVGGGADGINVLTGTVHLQFIGNNMITDNTGDAIDFVNTTNGGVTFNQRTRDNATACNNCGDWLTATNYDSVTTDTGGPETDYVSAGTPNFNYQLIYGSPATNVGTPLYADIGALQYQDLPTPTPTPTATATATFTPTPVPTCTATATPTATPTPTATATNTPTPTATATSTPTPTPPIETSGAYQG